MFCQKCGKELPDNTNFCSYCGAQQGGKTVTTTQSKNKKEKKNSKIIISLAVMAVTFCIGKFAIAPAMLSDSDSESVTDYTTTENVTEQNDTSILGTDDSQNTNTAYSDIFLSRNIVESPSVLLMLESSAFAIVREDDMIEKLEFGYEDDTVKEMINTLYYPIYDLSEEQKASLEMGVKDNLSQIESAEFCTASYNMGNSYFTVTLHFKELDDRNNIQVMSEFGILSGDGADWISMSETESSLLAAGYVKK